MFGRLVDMATRTLIIDLSKGTGGEPMYGIVTVQRARATSEGTFEVLPWETKLKLFNGIATITEAVTDGSGPFYDSAYLIRVQNGYCAPRWGFMAALPDGTTPISTGDMPKVNPITGEGIYMDAQEWNALYGTLPDRVTSLENSQSVQDGQIANLQTGKANTSHTHVIGDVTGLQPALDAKSNAAFELRGTGSPLLGNVSAPPGTYYTDVEGTNGAWRWLKVSGTGIAGWKVITGDTGWRSLGPLPSENSTAGDLRIRRVNDAVEVLVNGVKWNNISPGRNIAGPGMVVGAGFSPRSSASRSLLAVSDIDITFFDNLIPYIAGSNLYLRWVSRMGVDGFRTDPVTSEKSLTGSLVWSTQQPWPTTLPGTPA